MNYCAHCGLGFDRDDTDVNGRPWHYMYCPILSKSAPRDPAAELATDRELQRLNHIEFMGGDADNDEAA